jgi:hypothetical protein
VTILEREAKGTVDWNRNADDADLHSSAQVA